MEGSTLLGNCSDWNEISFAVHGISLHYLSLPIISGKGHAFSIPVLAKMRNSLHPEIRIPNINQWKDTKTKHWPFHETTLFFLKWEWLNFLYLYLEEGWTWDRMALCKFLAIIPPLNWESPLWHQQIITWTKNQREWPIKREILLRNFRSLSFV